MRKIFCVYMIVLLVSQCANSQSVDSLSLYKRALVLISRDLEVDLQDVAVSGIAYDLDCFMFFRTVKNSSWEKTLIERQNNQSLDTYSSVLDKNFNKLSHHTEYSVFFSNIKDGIILAQICKLQKNGKSLNYYSVINTALQQYYYMFILNRKGKIKKTYRVKVD